jgi:ribosome recycling factor
MIDDPLKKALADARDHMKKSLEHLQHELSHIRAGRANPTMVDEVRVDVYGSQMPLNQVASVSAPQSDMILIQPWDKGSLGPIEKAIQAANLGFNPTNDGQMIRIALPPLTEERRRELVKSAKAKSEDAKVAVRNGRRQGKDDIKRAVDEHSLSEDMKFESEDRLQKLTDEYVAKVDAMMDKKESEIMEV